MCKRDPGQSNVGWLVNFSNTVVIIRTTWLNIISAFRPHSLLACGSCVVALNSWSLRQCLQGEADAGVLCFYTMVVTVLLSVYLIWRRDGRIFTNVVCRLCS